MLQVSPGAFESFGMIPGLFLPTGSMSWPGPPELCLSFLKAYNGDGTGLSHLTELSAL